MAARENEAYTGEDEIKEISEPNGPDEIVPPSNGTFGGVSVELLDMQFRDYCWRWYVLATISGMAFATSLVMDTFSSIANYVDEFYCTTAGCRATNWIMLTSLIVRIPVGLLGMWLGDSYGLRAGALVGAWCVVTGALLRVVSALPLVPHQARFPVIIAGQLIAAVGSPFSRSLPTKMAALWFTERRRTIANGLPVIAVSLGVAVAFLCGPIVVDSPDKMLLWLTVTAVPSVVVVLMTTFGLRSSTPPTPPSSSAAQNLTPFWKGLRMILVNWQLLMMMTIDGCMNGLYNIFVALLQQILCPHGYSNVFAGTCVALTNGVSLIGSMVTSLVADRTRRHIYIYKLCYVIAGLSCVANVFLTTRPHMELGLLLTAIVFGCTAQSILGIYFELGAEISFPVAQMTSAGLQFMGILTSGVVFMTVLPRLATPSTLDQMPNQTCTVEATGSTVLVYDWTLAMIVYGGLSLAAAVACALIFWPKLHRRASEQNIRKLSIQLQEVRKASSARSVGGRSSQGISSINSDATIPSRKPSSARSLEIIVQAPSTEEYEPPSTQPSDHATKIGVPIDEQQPAVAS